MHRSGDRAILEPNSLFISIFAKRTFYTSFAADLSSISPAWNPLDIRAPKVAPGHILTKNRNIIPLMNRGGPPQLWVIPWGIVPFAVLWVKIISIDRMDARPPNPSYLSRIFLHQNPRKIDNFWGSPRKKRQ